MKEVRGQIARGKQYGEMYRNEEARELEVEEQRSGRSTFIEKKKKKTGKTQVKKRKTPNLRELAQGICRRERELQEREEREEERQQKDRQEEDRQEETRQDITDERTQHH